MQFRKIKIEHLSDTDRIPTQHIVSQERSTSQDVVITAKECRKACRTLSRRRKKNA